MWKTVVCGTPAQSHTPPGPGDIICPQQSYCQPAPIIIYILQEVTGLRFTRRPPPYFHQRRSAPSPTQAGSQTPSPLFTRATQRAAAALDKTPPPADLDNFRVGAGEPGSGV